MAKVDHTEHGVAVSEHGLKADAISFWEGLVVALASTAPAYSLAAVIGSIAVIVGFFAPAALLLAFVPMFFIAAAFYWMNRADQDCGTTFAWVTRAMGPVSHSAVSIEWARRSPVTPEPATSTSNRHNAAPPCGTSAEIVQSCK